MKKTVYGIIEYEGTTYEVITDPCYGYGNICIDGQCVAGYEALASDINEKPDKDGYVTSYLVQWNANDFEDMSKDYFFTPDSIKQEGCIGVW